MKEIFYKKTAWGLSLIGLSCITSIYGFSNVSITGPDTAPVAPHPLSWLMVMLDLPHLFETLGKVVYARVIRHPDTKLSRGFGFVEMSTQTEAEAALQGMLHKEYDGRKIVVTEAWGDQKPRGEL
jgi:hypothetical protein